MILHLILLTLGLILIPYDRGVYLGLMIPFAVITIIRPLIMIWAMKNRLNAAARKKSFYFYVVSTLIEIVYMAFWIVNLFRP